MSKSWKSAHVDMIFLTSIFIKINKLTCNLLASTDIKFDISPVVLSLMAAAEITRAF